MAALPEDDEAQLQRALALALEEAASAEAAAAAAAAAAAKQPAVAGASAEPPPQPATEESFICQYTKKRFKSRAAYENHTKSKKYLVLAAKAEAAKQHN